MVATPSLAAHKITHNRIVKSGVVGERVYDASQIDTSTSKQAIETAVKAALVTDYTLQLFGVK
jgi:hypothetical protein